MLIRKPNDIPSSEITPESVFLNRRQLLAATGAVAGLSMLPACSVEAAQVAPNWLANKIANSKGRTVNASDKLTPWEDATSYNNFYEFGFGKDDPAENAQKLKTDPWTIEISGEVAKPQKIFLEDLIKPHQLEERVYRFRCVEAWSMVVPWMGVSLADLVKQAEPTSKAKYVAFQTLHDPDQMPGQRSGLSSIEWPYVEALRLDEAMHPLSFMAVGMYGKVLPNQNGAPIRLVMPWKYGFKSIKSIVRIHVTSIQPRTTWNILAPHEYGFYANVNPEVDHPRWSQAHERRLPSPLFNPNRIATQKFNGYEAEVGHLYKGMDLAKYY